MRTAAILLTLAALAACAAPPDPKSGVREAAEEAAANDPRIMMADPAATNYAPPNWQLKPGDRITNDDWYQLPYDPDLGKAVVWVVSESGLPGAVPFGAWFRWEEGMLPGETLYIGPEGGTNEPPDPLRPQLHLRPNTHQLYVGHFPVKVSNMWSVPEGHIDRRDMEDGLPPALVGVLDPAINDIVRSSANTARQRSYPTVADFLEAERARYYGPGASW